MIEYPQRVLLATDGTEDSTRAARVAVALATRSGAELHVVHVGRNPSSSSGTTVEGGYLPGEPPGYARRQAEKLLQMMVEQLRAEGGTIAGAHLKMGQPAPEVVAVAVELGADLLVVGSGRPRAMRRAGAATIHRAAIGRVSDAIVRGAHCPVLVVRE